MIGGPIAKRTANAAINGSLLVHMHRCTKP